MTLVQWINLAAIAVGVVAVVLLVRVRILYRRGMRRIEEKYQARLKEIFRGKTR